MDDEYDCMLCQALKHPVSKPGEYWIDIEHIRVMNGRPRRQLPSLYSHLPVPFCAECAIVTLAMLMDVEIGFEFNY